MFITTHAAIGAFIGEQLPTHPYIAFAFGAISHFLVDIIPHGDTQLYKDYTAGKKVRSSIAYTVIDAVLAIFLILFFLNTVTSDAKFSVTMGIVGSILPDLIVGVYEVSRVTWLKWFHRLHFFFHNMISDTRDISFASGLGMQLVFLAVLLSFLT